MKAIKYLAVAAFTIIGFTQVNAQEKQEVKRDNVKMVKHRPAKMNAKKDWKKDLNLTEEQEEKIKEIRAKHKKEMEPLRKSMKEIREKERKEIHNVLTPEQQKMIEKKRAERKEKYGERQRKDSKQNKVHYKRQKDAKEKMLKK